MKQILNLFSLLLFVVIVFVLAYFAEWAAVGVLLLQQLYIIAQTTKNNKNQIGDDKEDS